MTPAPGLYPDIDHATYHRKSLGVASKSALDHVAKSPSHYLAWLSAEDKLTPALAFGQLFHAYVLEPAKCEAMFTIDREAEREFGDCRNADNKAARDAWRAETEHLTKVSKDDWEKCRRMAESLRKHPIAARLLEMATPEVSAFWVDAETELECKMRVDGWAESRGFALDLKTTLDASPAAFARAVADYRYHVQDAFYVDGITAITGTVPKGFVFIAVEKEPPYAVATYTLDDQARQRGRELYRRDLETLKRCIDTDEWPAYGHELQTLTLAPWQLLRG